MKITVDWIVKAVLQPTDINHRKMLTTPQFVFIITIVSIAAFASLPIIQQLVWSDLFNQSERAYFIKSQVEFKSWFESISYILDLTVAVLIGGSIFGERLAKSFESSIGNYEKMREAILKEEASDLGQTMKDTITNAVSKFNSYRNSSSKELIRNIPEIYREANIIKNVAFTDVPKFYKNYMRFVIYSSFPGGLYGVFAFGLFFTSAILKLFTMYLGSPYLAP